MTRKLIIHDGRAERELLLAGTIVVGRDPSCHINDLDPLLSRRHAEFVTTSKGVTLRDLGSRNGMLVNGTKTREHVLVEGDLIQLGHLQFRYLEDHNAPSPESVARAHATTAAAMDAATMAAPPHDIRLPVSELDDTQPHEHPVPHPAADHDATRATVRRDQPATAATADLDATVAPGSRPPAAAAALKPDAKGAPAPPDLDATIVTSGRDLDATIAPGAIDFDATFVPLRGGAVAGALSQADAHLVAGLDLRVQSANAACRQAFGAPPDSLVGQPLADLLSRSLQTLATGKGPASLSVVIERHSADRTIRATFKTGQAAETTS